MFGATHRISFYWNQTKTMGRKKTKIRGMKKENQLVKFEILVTWYGACDYDCGSDVWLLLLYLVARKPLDIKTHVSLYEVFGIEILGFLYSLLSIATRFKLQHTRKLVMATSSTYHHHKFHLISAKLVIAKCQMSFVIKIYAKMKENCFLQVHKKT